MTLGTAGPYDWPGGMHCSETPLHAMSFKHLRMTGLCRLRQSFPGPRLRRKPRRRGGRLPAPRLRQAGQTSLPAAVHGRASPGRRASGHGLRWQGSIKAQHPLRSLPAYQSASAPRPVRHRLGSSSTSRLTPQKTRALLDIRPPAVPSRPPIRAARIDSSIEPRRDSPRVRIPKLAEGSSPDRPPDPVPGEILSA